MMPRQGEWQRWATAWWWRRPVDQARTCPTEGNTRRTTPHTRRRTSGTVRGINSAKARAVWLASAAASDPPVPGAVDERLPDSRCGAVWGLLEEAAVSPSAGTPPLWPSVLRVAWWAWWAWWTWWTWWTWWRAAAPGERARR